MIHKGEIEILAAAFLSLWYFVMKIPTLASLNLNISLLFTLREQVVFKIELLQGLGPVPVYAGHLCDLMALVSHMHYNIRRSTPPCMKSTAQCPNLGSCPCL